MLLGVLAALGVLYAGVVLHVEDVGDVAKDERARIVEELTTALVETASVAVTAEGGAAAAGADELRVTLVAGPRRIRCIAERNCEMQHDARIAIAIGYARSTAVPHQRRFCKIPDGAEPLVPGVAAPDIEVPP